MADERATCAGGFNAIVESTTRPAHNSTTTLLLDSVGVTSRQVDIGSGVTLPILEDWIEHSRRRVWAGPGGALSITVREAEDVDLARVEQVSRLIGANDAHLVEIADRACIKLTGVVDHLPIIHYVIPLDIEREAWAVYSIEQTRRGELLDQLAGIERVDRFARLASSSRITADGAIVVAPIFVPANWQVVDSEGARVPLAPERGDELLDIDVSGSALFIGPPRTGLVIERLSLVGPITDVLIDRYLRDYRETSGSASEVVDRAIIGVLASDEAAARIELVDRKQNQFQLLYLFRDELLRNWYLSYQAPLANRESWIEKLRVFERVIPFG